MSELINFVKISKFAGERFDLTQAGGGNSSVKLSDGSMLIKASGYLLSEVSSEKGYVKVNNSELLKILRNESLLSLKDKRQREKLSNELVGKTVLSEGARPSIETLLHSLLQKYVLHTHPILVNAITCRPDWKDILLKLFPDSCLVGYQTPGLELSFELKKEIENWQKSHSGIPKIIFLQNHGLIIGSDNSEEVLSLYDFVINKLSLFLNFDLSRYSLTNKVSSLVNSFVKEPLIAFISDDLQLHNLLKVNRSLFFTAPFCPDTFVFCGYSTVEIKNVTDRQPLEGYFKKYGEVPKVIICEDNLFFTAIHLKKAREMEDVFKFHLLTASRASGNIVFLPEEELHYLGNWDAEKYRQKL